MVASLANSMSGQEIVDLNRQYVFFSWTAQSATNPIPVTGGEGVYFWDVDGRRYLDFSAQLMNLNLGHQHPRVVEAIKEQADALCYVYPGMATQVKGELGRLLAEITPPNLTKTFFTLGGAEANEHAIRMARMFTGRFKIISRYRAYHGATAGAMTLSGDPRRLAVEPLIPGVIHVFDPYCYRCVFGQRPETCHRECITHIEEVIKFEGPENVAAMFIEGVTGTSGLIIPPDDYWPRLREMCDKYGILLIADEVMSGFGRTGQWFAVNNWDIQPDMITMAKGLTSGYLPLGAVVVSQEIADYFGDHTLACGLTYSGHPMSCAAGVAAINVYKEEKVIENVRSMAEVLAQEYAALYERHPSIGDIRQIGLFSVIELVKNRETREPLAPWNAKVEELGVMAEVGPALRERGLYTFCKWNWIFVVPPLIINEAELKKGLSIIDEVLEITDAVVK